MPAPRPIDPAFLNRPFAAAAFLASGHTAKMLRSKRFVRLYPRVWVWASHVMTAADRRLAARLAMPPRAKMTDITLIQELGLDFGDAAPLHFVIDSDLHIDLEGIVLHRTAQMPPTTGGGVTPAAAFVAYCARARLIDAIAVGDWLLHREHMTLQELGELIVDQPWRRGATETRVVMPHLTERSRSIPESKLRVMFLASGIVGLEVNAFVQAPTGMPVEIDLLARRCHYAIEYEGSHHQESRDQYLKDIGRYEMFRAMKLHYKLVTKEHMRSPRALIINTFHQLVDHGYDGPPPSFGPTWQACFAQIRQPRVA